MDKQKLNTAPVKPLEKPGKKLPEVRKGGKKAPEKKPASKTSPEKAPAEKKIMSKTSPKPKNARTGKASKKPNSPPEKPLFTKFGKKIFNYKFEEQDLDDNTFLKYNVIGILFTGTWVTPAREFMENLTKLYKEVNENEKVFEIVQISNEKTEKNYKDAITEERPWLYVPFNDSYIPTLIEEYKVEFLPKFLIVNRDMFVLSQNGRKDMLDNPEGTAAYDLWYKAYRARKEELQKEKEEKEGAEHDTENYNEENDGGEISD